MNLAISTSWIEEEIRQTVIECDSIHQKTLLTLENLEQQCNIRLAEIQLQSKQQEMELLQKSESIKLANDRQLLQREAEVTT